METITELLLKSLKPFGKQVISEYQKTLQHLIWMASMNGAKKYAWDRAKKLDADPNGLWAGIADDLTKAMNEKSGKDGQQSK
jgi:hypothetical protein